MNYEELYQSLQPDQKVLKDSLASLQKLFKATSREAEGGDVKSLLRDLNVMKEAAGQLAATLESYEGIVGGFDTKAYFEGGEFAEQMLTICQEEGVDVRGDFPVYEMFPYRVKVDTENQDLYLDRKKYSV